MNFVLPSECNRDDVTDFYGEIAAGGGECIGIGNYGNYDLWLTGMKNGTPGKICRRAMCARIFTFAMRTENWSACSV